MSLYFVNKFINNTYTENNMIMESVRSRKPWFKPVFPYGISKWCRNLMNIIGIIYEIIEMSDYCNKLISFIVLLAFITDISYLLLVCQSSYIFTWNISN